ncbi:GIY-YIG nuclease family protein [Aquimarina sp. U1-2]|uniref:GIY-YIG nuclease family protein n=1 Tax=Aquimarina sp. U1-2 TaxID=2823141 RepID=UPI001AECA51C|nr:GIY-YIG nuclease family protein [Aquimarina sp. U1-2]MBP2831297.1 GIY-YIG nuclease family protein [Aquimarina sp. U1-2]
MKTAHVYLMTNKNNTVIYTGVTSNLLKRVYQHKTKAFAKSFTARYNCDKLVYFEEFHSIIEAIAREKQIKAGNRKRKENLIHSNNPDWSDLSEGWLFHFD